MTNMIDTSADLLIEIGTEELPPKDLRTLRSAFEQQVSEGLSNRNIGFEASGLELASPRRLAVLLKQVDLKQPDQASEVLGPNLKAAFDSEGQPTQAALGFAKKVGVEVAHLDHAETPKGARLCYRSTIEGKRTEELLEQIINEALGGLPINKRMRWGASRSEFVRPVHWALVLLGERPLDMSVMGLKTGSSSRGHRFHANYELQIDRPENYQAILLDQGKVAVDYQKRLKTIEDQVQRIAEEDLGGQAVIDPDLLEEVCSLVEWPVALAGRFDEAFLNVPGEALISSMKSHQKYFHIVDSDGQLQPYFITVANIESREPGKIIDGNERVIRPRLADAAFFYESDLKKEFAQFRSSLKSVTFQARLGSVYSKTERVAALARSIAGQIGANAEEAYRAGQLCKCDLVSEMVLEFGDLQGLMGQYYAQASGEPDAVAKAMFEHYLPRFAGDELPGSPTGIAVALADRIDTLVGIFSIGEIPTGSKDPFALRRASLGLLRIMVELELPLDIVALLNQALDQLAGEVGSNDGNDIVTQVLDYILDRFANWFSDLNIATESFMAVRALNLSVPLDIFERVRSVDQFAKTDSAEALAAANKRVANILAKSEIDEGSLSDIDQTLFEPAEAALYDKLQRVCHSIEPVIEQRDYPAALYELASLREVVDAFFDQVMVMVDDQAQRRNRIMLLQQLRSAFLSVADIALLA